MALLLLYLHFWMFCSFKVHLMVCTLICPNAKCFGLLVINLLRIFLLLLSVWFFLRLVVLIFWAPRSGILLNSFPPLWVWLLTVCLFCKHAFEIWRILRLNYFCCVVVWVFVSLTIFYGLYLLAVWTPS